MEFDANRKFVAANFADGRFYLVGEGEKKELVAEYQHKDHLGNVRVAFSDRNGDKRLQLLDGAAGASEVTQINDYFPFGLPFPKACGAVVVPENRYKFNGIEHIAELELDMAAFRSYDAAIGRWGQVDPKAEAFPWASPYNAMLNNPIINIDPLGDTTRVYNMNGELVRTVNDSHENQEHFLTDRNLELISGSDMSDMDEDGIGMAFRNSSSFFIGANTRAQLKEVTDLAESEGLERAYTLSYSATVKELQVNDITGNRKRTSNSVNLPGEVSSGNLTDVIVGHVHPTAGAVNIGVDPSNAGRVNTPSGGRGLQDYQSLLTGDYSRAYPQIISSVHGYNVYTSARYAPAGSKYPYQILSNRGTVINYSGVKVVD